MFRFFTLQFPSFSPDGPSSGDMGGGVDDFSSDMDILNANDDPPEEGDEEAEKEDEEESDEEPKPKVKKEKKDDSDDVEEDGDEEESDDEEDNDDEDEDADEDDEDKPEPKPIRIEGKPTVQELKKLAPELFKQVPYLRDAFFNYDKFTAIFPDPEAAQDASDKANFYNEIEASVVAGDPKVLLQNIKEGNPAAYGKFVENLLPTLRTLDNDTYMKVSLPIIKELLYHATQYGKKRENTPQGQNIIKSAKWIADFVFANGGEIPDLEVRTEKHPAEVELDNLRAKAARELQGASVTDTNKRIDAALAPMLAGLDSRLTAMEKEYIKGKALDKTLEILVKDTAFSTKMRGLWKRAQTAQYSEASKVAITTAHVARARLVLKDVRDRMVQDALKGRGKPKRVEQDEIQPPKKRKLDSQGRGGSSGRRPAVLDSSKIDYRKTSDLDILSGIDSGRVKFKGQRR